MSYQPHSPTSMPCMDAHTHQRAGHDTPTGRQTRKQGNDAAKAAHQRRKATGSHKPTGDVCEGPPHKAGWVFRLGVMSQVAGSFFSSMNTLSGAAFDERRNAKRQPGMTRTRPHPARDAMLAYIVAHPGQRRAQIAEGMRKGPNATSRVLYLLHITGYITPSGVGKCTTWTAVAKPEPRPAPSYKTAPIAPWAVPFGGASSIFAVGAE